MITYLLTLALLIWPFGQLLNLQLPGQTMVIYPLDLICILLTLSLLFSKPRRLQVIRDPLSQPLALFLFFASLSLLFNLQFAASGGLVVAVSYLLRLFIYPSVYFAAKIAPSRQVLRPALFSLGFFSLLGILQYLFFPDMRFLKNLGFDDHYFRLIGSFYDPNFAGSIFAASALVFLSLSRWPAVVTMVLLLALTFSRASYLVFLLGTIFIFLAQKKRALLWVLLLLGGIIIFIPKPFGEGVNLLRTFSIYSRFDSWQNGLNLFFQKPFFGWGYNTLRGFTGQRFQIDSSLLYLAATTGLFGTLAFLSLLRSALRQITFLPQKIFILALLFHSLFNNSLFYIWLYFAFWLVLGLPTKEYTKS